MERGATAELDEVLARRREIIGDTNRTVSGRMMRTPVPPIVKVKQRCQEIEGPLASDEQEPGADDARISPEAGQSGWWKSLLGLNDANSEHSTTGSPFSTATPQLNSPDLLSVGATGAPLTEVVAVPQGLEAVQHALKSWRFDSKTASVSGQGSGADGGHMSIASKLAALQGSANATTLSELGMAPPRASDGAGAGGDSFSGKCRTCTAWDTWCGGQTLHADADVVTVDSWVYDQMPGEARRAETEALSAQIMGKAIAVPVDNQELSSVRKALDKDF
eukprot:CAMPEP_0195086800 /NCGR_PEP_ID=MMETSP0448-20130528/26833_1 /TAXON_ID=66468 /ORGANISM="Heterocapsa triquestra, Strain CCMP 448" /LENGTH=276 /DNA_ID=CAMNT_0040120311 /DNA_START=12 /DNA_END=842 /DNA_ORIENTATION=-